MRRHRTASSNTATGRRGPKVKSGCRTCKIRKLKCDESRPACHRCISSGHTCDGYGIWGGGGSSYQSSLNSSMPNCSAGSRNRVPIPRNEARFPNHRKDGRATPKSTNLLTTKSPAYDRAIGNSYVQVIVTAPSLESSELSSPDKRQCMFPSVQTPLIGIPGTLKERGLLHLFQGFTVNKLPGLFPSEFWSFLLPQASYSEPAVLNAVLALTSAHNYEESGIILNQPSAEEQFTLQAYSRAIRYLKPHFNLESNASLRITLITCILFVCLEIVQRHYGTALSHLSNGLKLIKQVKPPRIAIGTDAILSPNDLIIQMFLKLSLQIKMLGNSHFQPVLIRNVVFMDKPPDVFLSTAEARKYLDFLIARIFELNDLRHKENSLQQALSTLSDQQSTLQVDLNLWLGAFAASGLESDPSVSTWRKAACIILRMYHTMAVIMASTCLFPNQESAFDHQWRYFESIIDYAIYTRNIIEATQATAQPANSAETHGAIIDIGWIPALYFTAIKCRVRGIRLKAIGLLESTSHREGFWDATMAARVAREVMRIEEGGEQGTRMYDSFTVDGMHMEDEILLSTALELRRVHDVEVVLPNKPLGRVRMMCCRNQADGNRETIWREYDWISGVWSDIDAQTQYDM
ncbi:hypothetical protein CC78DRAFT_530575 [Lojkania enalia]|uniref:Zn(2)-C6 fungal-type domain-containing protein n=1 Tax=Lojkania enalia TaxID=147567 RepID=A0A9P4KJ33_9PLEO|nr:hypothetical protein CC78DRAFT_530575 [Didymosphaeria enalia]